MTETINGKNKEISKPEKPRLADARVFVPEKYLGNSLKSGCLEIPPMGVGLTMPQEEFRKRLAEGSVSKEVVRDLAFIVFS